MISIWWLLVAAAVGFIGGVFALALMAMASRESPRFYIENESERWQL